MTEQKYYFISYAWRRRGNKEYNYENGVRDSDPLDGLLRWKGYDDEIHDEWRLLFYNEITKEQYDMLNGNID